MTLEVFRSDLPLPFSRDTTILPLLGRFILLAGGLYNLWVWLSSLEPTWTMPVYSALWFIPAVAAPQSRSTRIESDGIVLETRWPWGIRRRRIPAQSLRRAWVAEHKSWRSSQPGFYVVIKTNQKLEQELFYSTCHDEAAKVATWLQALADTVGASEPPSTPAQSD